MRSRSKAPRPVDLVNELGKLAEDQDAVIARVRKKARGMDPRGLSRAISVYAKYSTQEKFKEIATCRLNLFFTRRTISSRWRCCREQNIRSTRKNHQRCPP